MYKDTCMCTDFFCTDDGLLNIYTTVQQCNMTCNMMLTSVTHLV